MYRFLTKWWFSNLPCYSTWRIRQQFFPCVDQVPSSNINQKHPELDHKLFYQKLLTFSSLALASFTWFLFVCLPKFWTKMPCSDTIHLPNLQTYRRHAERQVSDLCWAPPWNLRILPKIAMFERRYILQTIIFGISIYVSLCIYVRFLGCKSLREAGEGAFWMALNLMGFQLLLPLRSWTNAD